MKKLILSFYIKIQKFLYSSHLYLKDYNLYKFIKTKVEHDYVKQEILYRLGKGLYLNNKTKSTVNINAIKKDWDLVFISQKTSPDLIKDIIAIKSINSNIKACLLTSDIAQVDTLANKYFDQIIFYNNEYDLILNVKEMNCKNVIVRRGDEYQVYLVTLFYEDKIIYRPYPFVARYPEKIWGADKNYCEREIIKKSRGIYHLYDKNAEDYINEKYDVKCPMIAVRSECMPELAPNCNIEKLSKSDGEIHIVYAAGIQRENSPDHITGHSNQYEKFKTILDQGIHIHWYQAYPRLHDKSHGLKKYFNLVHEYGNFHREEPLEYDKLLQVLPKYDWAFQHFSFEKVAIQKEFRNGISNGFYTHLQSGNLCIVSPSTPLYANIVKKYNIGIVLDDLSDFNTIKEKIKSIKFNGLKDRLYKAQSENQYPKKELYNLIFETN